MPRLILPEGRTETLVDAINYLLARDGAGALSLRSIARVSRVSTSSMLHHFGSRAHLLRVAAGHTGRARLSVVERRARSEGAGAFLPADDDEEDLITAGAWLAWCELWRCEPAVTSTITDIRDREYALLGRILGVPLRAHSLVSLMALIDGLLVAVCAPERPLLPARARDILLAHVEGQPLVSAS
jgi:AcrR family transcriptional regulator